MAKLIKLFRIYSLLILLAVITCINGVIQAPRSFSLFTGQDNPKWTPRLYENEPAELVIASGDTEEIVLQENSSVTVRLTRAVEVPVDVLVTIQSDEGIIEFKTGDHLAPVISQPNTFKITYPAREFGDRVINYHSKDTPGHAEIICKIDKQPEGDFIDARKAFVSIDVGRARWIWTVMLIMGWLYFAAWSISFYPQIILNCRRKSVIGLNFDFIALNLIGFAMYSIYNISLLYSRTVQEHYYERYAYSRIPVEYNDLFFSVHAAIITLVTILQCFVYERGDQKLSLASIIFSVVTISVGAILYLISQFKSVNLLDVILYFSYVKLAITLIKYIPQAYMNYERKSTIGWSIHNIMLDSTGGVLSLGQMLLAAYNYNDWISIFGNPTKFGLGIFSISFDILFFLQHYVFYKNSNGGQMDIANDADTDDNSGQRHQDHHI